MSKRPSLGPDTVVRKSRLAAKGEAVPALVHGQHSHRDHPDAGSPSEAPVVKTPPSAPPSPEPEIRPVQVFEASAETPLESGSEAKPELRSAEPKPEPAVAIEVAPAPPALQSVVDGLLAALADRDRQLDQFRTELLRVEQERLREQAAASQDRDHGMAKLGERDRQLEELRTELSRVEQERQAERASASRDRDQTVANLAAADATIDELRNRVSDLRGSLEQSRAELARLVEQHAAERQALLAAANRPVPTAVPVVTPPPPLAVKLEPSNPPPPSATASTAAPVGVLQSARRWLFGDEEATPPTPSPVNQKSVTSQNKPSAYQPRAAVPQAPGPGPASARPSVIKPLGPPTAPKVLNRRPVN